MCLQMLQLRRIRLRQSLWFVHIMIQWIFQFSQSLTFNNCIRQKFILLINHNVHNVTLILIHINHNTHIRILCLFKQINHTCFNGLDVVLQSIVAVQWLCA
eukprot:60946_1